MTESDTATAKRMGRPPKITREEILDAASRSDPAGLPFTALAERLGISVKTVYYYFPNRQALIDAITEQAIARMNLPDIAECPTWQAVMREVALWYRHLGVSQPGWMNDPAAPVGIKKVGLAILRLSCRKLAEFGWTMHDAYRAHIVVSNWAISHGESARTVDGDYSPQSIGKVLGEYGDVSLVEELSRIMHPFRSASEVFEDGLEIVLAGIEQKIVNAA